MGLLGWISYIFLGVFFFLILSFIQNKYQISKLEKMIFSLILLMLSAGVFYQFALPYTDNIFLVFVFLLISDVIYTSYFIEKDFFDKNERNVFYYVVLIIIGFFINQEFINQVNRVFLTGEDLRIILWSLSFVFLYYFSKNKSIFTNINIEKNQLMSKVSVLIHYAKLKYQFYDDCDYDNKELSNIIYSIMIFENDRRSKIMRKLDYFFFRLNGSKRKLGIMQVESDKFITDSESIELVHKEILKIYENHQSKKKLRVEDVLQDYCGEDYKSVQYIFDIIKKF